MTNVRRISIAAAALVTAATLAGCSVADTLQNETSSEFDSVTALTKKWDLPVAWLPADSTDIHTHSAINGDIAIVGVTSSAALDPAICAVTERKSGPVYEQDWSPNPYVDIAWACGDWTVIGTDDGWYGWTPNDPGEQKASPTSAEDAARG
jgi:hypothetical protein